MLVRRLLYVFVLFFSTNLFAQPLITPNLQLSRTIGVAPLSIFADASGTTGLTRDDLVNADIQINFDATNVDPANAFSRESGFVSAHVYPNPGTYTIRMTVTDRAGVVAEAAPVQVTVLDPAVEYMPRKGQTYCFSTTLRNNFVGCPTTNPNRRIVTDNFSQALQYAAVSNRLLFDRGAVWQQNSAQISNINGPLFIGGFPSPNTPQPTKPNLVSNGDNWTEVLRLDSVNDVTIADFSISGAWQSGASPTVSGVSVVSSSNVTLSNLELKKLNGNAFYLGAGSTTSDGVSIIGSEVQDSRQYAIYGGSSRFAAIDNYIHDLHLNQHAIRIQGGLKTFIAHNQIVNIPETFTSVTIRGNNNLAVISGNTLGAISTFAPQNNESTEYVTNILAQKNILIHTPGQAASNIGFLCTARGVAIRNNIFLNTATAVALSNHPLVGGCQNVTIANNTYFNTDTPVNNEHHFLYAQSMSNKIDFKNNIYYSTSSTNWGSALLLDMPLSRIRSNFNLFYAPNQPSSWIFAYAGASYSFSNWQNLGKDAQSLMTNPQFESINPSSNAFLKPAMSSPAVDSAAVVVSAEDIYGAPRPQDGNTDGVVGVDMGAIER